MNLASSEKTCKRGHPLSGDNIWEYQRGTYTQRICKACHKLRAKSRNRKQYREHNKNYYERRGADKLREKLYGITKQEFDTLMDKQDGKCAVCKQEQHGKSLAVDHCHETGAIRGLLCERCNRAAGLLKDSAENAQRMAEYLS